MLNPRTKKNRGPYILIIILFFLLAFIYTFKILPDKYQTERLDRKIFNLKPDEITRIEVNQTGETEIILTKDNNWLFDGKPADTEEIRSALADLANFTQDKLISSDETKFSQFEVDSDHGLALKLFKENDLKAEILIGKIGPVFSSNYVRSARDKKIYLVNKNISLFWQKTNWQKTETEQ